MRWWLRLVLTLVFGPPVWWILTGYVATQEGSTLGQWWQNAPKVLAEIYVLYTLPALLLCAILLGIDRLLKFGSLDLFTVLVSPLAAFGLAWTAVHFIDEPHVGAAGASLPLFVCYGLVWGLTIREPGRRRDGDRSDGAFVEALLPSAAAGRPDESLKQG